MASSSKLPKPDILSPLKTPIEQPPPPPTTVTTTTTTTRKRKLESITNPSEILTPSSIEDECLSSSSHLTHQELIRRRLHRLNQLSKVYKDHYWALMEDLRAQYRDYYWKYGVSPCKDDEERERESGNCHKGDFGAFHAEGCGETNHQNQSNNNINHNQTHVNNNNGGVVVGGVGNSGGNLGLGFGEEVKLGGNNRCAFVVCKLKAMAMTSFCYLHILSDPNQKLYKACTYMIKFAQQGPILCGRPILKSTVPALCNIHFPKAQKDVKHALKKAGLNVSSSAKLAPKFHVLVAEYVHHIQSKRRATQKLNSKSIVIKEETS